MIAERQPPTRAEPAWHFLAGGSSHMKLLSRNAKVLDGWLRWTAAEVSALFVVSIVFLVVYTQPAITGVLARDLGFHGTALGAFGSAELVGNAVGGLLAVFAMRYWSPRTTVVTALLLLCIADSFSAISVGESTVVGLRILGGTGTGLASGACFYVFSIRNRERNFAAWTLGSAALAAGVIAAIPPVTSEFGARGLFTALALLVLPCFICTGAFPVSYAHEKPKGAGANPAPKSILALGLIAYALFQMGQLALWTYLERIGAAAGIAESQITAALLLSTVVGMVSSVLALFLGYRVSRRLPVAICVLLNVLGALAMTSTVPWIYAVSVSAFYFSLPFYAASQFGAVMRRAPSNRFAATFNVAGYAGAAGPSLGSLLAERFGVGSVRWLDITLIGASAVLLWIGFMKPSNRSVGQGAGELEGAK